MTNTKAYDPGSSEMWLQSTEMTAVELTPINQVKIIGAKMPVAGGKVGDFLNLSTTDSTYVIREKDWRCGTDAEWLESNDVFEAGKEYYLRVVVRPADGYCMSEDTKIVFNGGAIATDDDYTFVDSNGTLYGYTMDYTVTNGLAAPTVTLSNDAATGKTKVSWNAVNGAVKYEVYRAESKTGTYSKIATVTTAGKTYYQTTGGTPGVTYYYKVRAIDANGIASDYSAIKSVAVDCKAPVVSISLTAKGNPQLSWTKVDGATKYEIYRATSKTGEYTRINTVSTVPYINSTNVTSGTTYYYKVIALCDKSAYGNSAYSNVVSIKKP